VGRLLLQAKVVLAAAAVLAALVEPVAVVVVQGQLARQLRVIPGGLGEMAQHLAFQGHQ